MLAVFSLPCIGHLNLSLFTSLRFAAKKAGEGSSKEAESKEGGKDEELPDAAE